MTQPMSLDPLKTGALIKNSEGIGTVTRKMLRERAMELAVINEAVPSRRFQNPTGKQPSAN